MRRRAVRKVRNRHAPLSTLGRNPAYMDLKTLLKYERAGLCGFPMGLRCTGYSRRPAFCLPRLLPERFHERSSGLLIPISSNSGNG
jgi:hypothetical protein